jgi:hypothetical protein
MKITITEALAEVKTIGKRIEKKKEFIAAYVLRQEMVKDPLEKDGGSNKALNAALQSIGDLQERLIRIRAAIQRSNLATTLTVGDKARSITDWLTWRKEVAPGEQKMLMQIRTSIEQNRQQMRTKGISVGAVSVETKPTDVIVNLDEGQLARSAEALEETLGTLDGKLSLMNATTTVDID